jgi:hypothetical protein
MELVATSPSTHNLRTPMRNPLPLDGGPLCHHSKLCQRWPHHGAQANTMPFAVLYNFDEM